MKKLSILVLIATWSTLEIGHAREVIDKGDVVVAPINGEISPSLLTFLRRALKTAETSGARAIIFEMNTYGGRLDSAEEITSALNHATIPTYTFINSNAGSAGALIALATQHIYMAPVSAIGAAAPVLPTGEDLPLTAREKTISYWSALIRGSALKNGHNPDIGEAFMNKEKEVKIGDRVIHAKGTLLTLNTQEATEKINGKPLLADGVAESIVDLAKKADLKGNVVSINPTGFEQLALWITALAPFALFILGLVLVIIEILFFAHSTIVFGVLGVLLMLASMLWAMVDRYPEQPFFPTGEMLAVPLRNLFIALVSAAIVIAMLARYLPRTSVYRRFALMTSNPPGPSLAGVPREFATSIDLSPGTKGISLSILRPSGKARFLDETVDVVTQGEFIPPNTSVTVVRRDGMRVVVKSSA